MMTRIAFFFSLLSLSAFAQNKEVSTEILSLALDEPVSGVYFESAGSIVPFDANLTGFSEPRVYKGSRRFVLRASLADFKKEPPPPPVGVVDLPPDADRVLLLCVNSKDQPLKLIAYNISSSGSEVGNYQFFNFSNTTVSAIFGEQKFAIEPAADKLVSSPSWKSEVSEIDVQLAIVEEGKPKRVYSSVWGHRPGRRSYVFLFSGNQIYRPIRISRFFDVPSISISETP